MLKVTVSKTKKSVLFISPALPRTKEIIKKLINYLGHSIIFPTKGPEVTNKILLAILYQYLGNFD